MKRKHTGLFDDGACRVFVVLATVAGLALVPGCGKDENNPTGPGNIGESNAGTVNGVAYGIVLPLIQQIGLQAYLSQINPAGGTPSTDACEPLDFCTSGSAELCTDPGFIQLNFTQCAAFGTEIDGTLSLNYTAGSGSGTFALVLGASGNISATGNVSFTSQPDCFSQILTNVTIVANDIPMTMGGSVSWCPAAMLGGEDFPDYASFEITIPSLGQIVDFGMYSNPAVGDLEVILLNLSRTEILYLCHGNITGSSLSCTSDVYDN